nr:hypothetical protein [uncultured bacterium]
MSSAHRTPNFCSLKSPKSQGRNLKRIKCQLVDNIEVSVRFPQGLGNSHLP